MLSDLGFTRWLFAYPAKCASLALQFHFLKARWTPPEFPILINPLDRIFMEPVLAVRALVAMQQLIAAFDHEIEEVWHYLPV